MCFVNIWYFKGFEWWLGGVVIFKSFEEER